MNDTAKTTDINEEPMMKNVCAYCRVSTNIPHQKGSYESQLEYYENMIRSKADWNFVGIYADYGKSGTKEKGRTDFMRMLEDCEAGHRFGETVNPHTGGADGKRCSTNSRGFPAAALFCPAKPPKNPDPPWPPLPA